MTKADLLKTALKHRAKIDRLEKLVVEAADWNWLDDDAEDFIPQEVIQAVNLCRTHVDNARG